MSVEKGIITFRFSSNNMKSQKLQKLLSQKTGGKRSLARARLSERESGTYITVERFVPVLHDNWGVLIGQSGQQCKLHIITLSRNQF